MTNTNAEGYEENIEDITLVTDRVSAESTD